MVGYKCNMCDKEISEKEYFLTRDNGGDLSCKSCGKGQYEAYFIDTDDEINKDANFTKNELEDEYKPYKSKPQHIGQDITHKFKDAVDKGKDLPGATFLNRVIGTITAAVVGSMFLEGFPFIGWLLVIICGVGGFFFAPYFVPTMRKVFRKIIKWIKDKTDDMDD